MINVLNLEFGFNKNNTSKEKTIYNKGNIIRPLTSKQKLEKEMKKEENEIKILKRPIQSARVKLLKKQFDEDPDEGKFYIGEILRSSFEENELEDLTEIDPDPNVNKRNYLLKIGKLKIEKKEKIKPYLPPDSVYESKKKEDKSKENIKRELQRTINIYKENLRIENKIIDMIKSSKFINDDEEIKVKNKKYERVEKEIQRLKEFREKCKKEKEKLKKSNDNENNDKFQFLEEEIKGDNTEFIPDNNQNNNVEKEKIKNKKNKKQKNEEKEKEKEIKIEKEFENDEKILKEKEKNKLKLPKDPISKTYDTIVKMDQEKKYKKAEEDIKRDKEECKKIQEKILDIRQELKNNVISTRIPKQTLSNKQKIEAKEKAKKLIDDIKQNINPDDFDIENLTPEEQKLIKGRKRYKPNKKKKKKYENDINKIKEKNENDYIYKNSVDSINKLRDSQNNLDNVFKEIHKIGREYKKVNQDFNNKLMFSDAFLNNLNKGKNINLEKISNKENTTFNNKKDIFDYMYFGKEEKKENKKESFSETENTEEINYHHPFLIYD